MNSVLSARQKTPLITVKGLRKDLAGNPLLDIAHLELYAGEAVLLTGRNGAGKSTLLRILAGLERADQGCLHYGESSKNGPTPRDVIYLHQQPMLFDRSVADNIGYGLKVRGCSRAEIADRVTHALHWSGLEHLARRNAKTLSGGEKQRVALTRAWVLEPRYLLLDEPTANMDGEALTLTLQLVARLVAEGVGIVLCSHGLRADSPLFKRALHLHNSLLRELKSPQNLPTNGPTNELAKSMDATKQCVCQRSIS